MSSFLIFFLCLGIVCGAAGRMYDRVDSTSRSVALGLVITLVATGTLFLMQATIVASEAINSVIFWLIGFVFGWLVTMARSAKPH